MPDETLPVGLYGTRIGELRRAGRDGLSFAVDAEAVERYGTGSPVLSLSLPLQRSRAFRAPADSFFGGLLPEGEALDRLATLATTTRSDLFGLLAAAGRDVAGAVTIGEPAATRGAYRAITDIEVADRLRSAGRYPLGETTGGTSLPGYQRKITLARFESRFYAREGDAPSTHILKPSRAPEYLTALQTEAWVLDLARRSGLAAYGSFLQDFDGVTALVIERYDRTVDARTHTASRIHQEDTAQAMSLGFGLYDRFEWHDPRASLASIASLLDRGRTAFATDASDRELLLRYVTFNVAVGNTDAHAKNFSLLHFDDGSVSLAPLYDVSAHALGYDSDQRMASAVGGEWHLPEVTRDHLATEGTGWGVERDVAEAIVADTLESLLSAVDEAPDPLAFPEHLPNYVRHQAHNLLQGRPAGIRSTIPPILLQRIDTPLP